MAETRVYESKDKNQNEVKLAFNDLTQVVLTKGDFIYREYFSKAIRAGVMTSAEALKILKDREIWGQEEEERVVEIQVEIAKTEVELDKLDKRDAASLRLYDKIKNLRQELASLNAIRTGITENTAESMAAEMRTQYFASECAVYNDTGRKVFKDLNDFLSRLDEQLATDSYREALILNYEKALGITLPKDLGAIELPEDEWLTKVREAEEEVSKPKKPKRKTKKRKTRKKTTTTA